MEDADAKKTGVEAPAGPEGVDSPLEASKPRWRINATKRTAAIYFPVLRELHLVKRAARRAGVPWTRFIREACVAKARLVFEPSNDAAKEAS